MRPTKLIIRGFKSLRDEVSLEVGPVTVLAGENSAGKSSALQPFLLLKQTLESPFDPGALLLSGPLVKFNSLDDLLWRGRAKTERAHEFTVGAVYEGWPEFRAVFGRALDGAIALLRVEFGPDQIAVREAKGADPDVAVTRWLDSRLPPEQRARAHDWRTQRSRCALEPTLYFDDGGVTRLDLMRLNWIQALLQLPGLRGNPERTYPITGVGDRFPGPFVPYLASVIAGWQDAGDARVARLGEWLRRLGLSWKVAARRLDDARAELTVGRMPGPQQGGAHDLVNIADVGVGVSQVLPVLVALLVARQDLLISIEQPEIHLHPRAQRVLAEIIVEAALASQARVIVETHSPLMLLKFQELVAKGTASPSDIVLHWFQRGPHGESRVHSTHLDADGAYGEWPIDFDQVERQADDDYLEAVFARETA